MHILLHICCAPCLVFPYKALADSGHLVRGFFYNPNIHPYTEFQKRLDTLESYARDIGLDLIVRPDYPLDEWLRAVVFREADRCSYCYHLRLSAAAKLAKKSGYEAFTTTLLYSKLQDHQMIRDICQAAGREAGIDFFYQDFRTGWREGQEGSKEVGLYRQQYCGCVYSERDRFERRSTRQAKRGVAYDG